MLISYIAERVTWPLRRILQRLIMNSQDVQFEQNQGAVLDALHEALMVAMQTKQAAMASVACSVPPPASQAPPASPSMHMEDSGHLLGLCMERMADIYAQAKVSGWTPELQRRKAALMPLMTQLLEDDNNTAIPVVAASAAAAAAAVALSVAATSTLPAASLLPSIPPMVMPMVLPPTLPPAVPTAAPDTLAALAMSIQAPPFDVSSLAASLNAAMVGPLGSTSLFPHMPPPHIFPPHITHRGGASDNAHSSSTTGTYSIGSMRGSLGLGGVEKKQGASRRGGARLDTSIVTVEFLEQQGLLALPEHEAAAHLGVGVNTLKRHCRYVGALLSS